MHYKKITQKSQYIIFFLVICVITPFFNSFYDYVYFYNKFVPNWITVIGEYRMGDLPYEFPSNKFNEYLIGLSVGIAIYYSFGFLKLKNNDILALKFIWTIQLFTIFLLSFFLEQNKGIDAYGYYYLSHNYVDYTFDFTDIEHNFIIGNGTNNIIYISRIFNSLFYSSFFLQTLLFSLFGLIGIFFVYRNILSFGIKNYNALLFLLLFPSIFIFTSTIGKDGIVFCGLSLVFYSINRKTKINILLKIIIFLIGILLIFMIRAWISYIIILSLFFFIFVYYFKKLKITLIFLSILTLVFCLLLLSNNFDIIKLIIESSTKYEVDKNKLYGLANIFISFQNNFIIPERMGSYGNFINFFSNFREFLIFLPKGFFATLFRPMLFIDKHSVIIIIAGLQNFILFILFLNIVLKNNIFLVRVFKNEDFIFSIVYIIIFTLLYCVIIYMNFGSGFRYQLQLFPALIFYFI